MVVLEAKVESVAAEKKAKYSAKVNKAKSLKVKRKADEEETIVTAPPAPSVSKKGKLITKTDDSVGGQQTPKRKKSLKFQEEVEVKEIENKPQKKNKKEKLEGKIIEKKDKVFPLFVR